MADDFPKDGGDGAKRLAPYDDSSVEWSTPLSPKKQCLGIPSSSKSGNEGQHGSDPELESPPLDASSKGVGAQKQVVGESVKVPLDLQQQHTMTSETESDSESKENTSESSESEDESVPEYSEEDDGFIRYRDMWDDRAVYSIRLKHKCRGESHCKDVLKEIGCESYFLRCSETIRRHFYARLKKKEAAEMKRINGVADVTPGVDVYGV